MPIRLWWHRLSSKIELETKKNLEIDGTNKVVYIPTSIFLMLF